jgi:hypothetical protein
MSHSSRDGTESEQPPKLPRGICAKLKFVLQAKFSRTPARQQAHPKILDPASDIDA